MQFLFSRKLTDFIAVSFLVVGGLLVLLFFDLEHFTTLASGILLFGIPSLYLLLRNPRNAKKAILGG